jgi:phosphoglycolate phosphatase
VNWSNYELIVFDKDGTLIDFHAMWSGWAEGLAAGLEAATGLGLANDLYAALGYDAASRQTLAGGPLAASTMADLRGLTVATVRGRGLSAERAEAAVSVAWLAPDPVAKARPCADLPGLFEALRARGLKLAVATTDDRVPTLATLRALGVLDLLETVVCADDGLPSKPAPDMLLAACRAAGTTPERAVMVGDSLADMEMARRVGALRVGVLTGVTGRAALEAAADVVLESVAELWS